MDDERQGRRECPYGHMGATEDADSRHPAPHRDMADHPRKEFFYCSFPSSMVRRATEPLLHVDSRPVAEQALGPRRCPPTSRGRPLRARPRTPSRRAVEQPPDRVGQLVDRRRATRGDVDDRRPRTPAASAASRFAVDDVVDVREVARLLAVAVDGHRLAVRDRADEARHDGGVLRHRVLARAEDVEVAERDDLHPVHAAEARCKSAPPRASRRRTARSAPGAATRRAEARRRSRRPTRTRRSRPAAHPRPARPGGR